MGREYEIDRDNDGRAEEAAPAVVESAEVAQVEVGAGPPPVTIEVGVRYRRAGKIYSFSAAGLELNIGEWVVVETEHGAKLGTIVTPPREVPAQDLEEPLKPVMRLATAEDMEKREQVRQKEVEAVAKCRDLAMKHSLPIKLLDAEGVLEGNYITIYFGAEGRVDFRQLVRELAGALRTRVELHQVGPRDKTKLMGGIGKCGYEMCCASFLTCFNPLSIKIAKEQSLSLEPAKISGICGRLLCCLGYERDLYRQFKECAPGPGQRVATPMGEGHVIGLNPVKEIVVVRLDSGAVVEMGPDVVVLTEGKGPGDQRQGNGRER